MMRYKAFGLGMMAFGGVVLAATASLAMKAARAGKDVPEQQAVAKQARTWVRTLPGGVTVELVGVSPYPATPGTWKSPDGEPLPTPPYSRPSYTIEPGEDRQAWEFALHVANLPEGGESRRWKILTPSSGFYASGHPRDAKGETVPGVGSIAVELPQDRRSCTVRFGIASGRWKTVVADGPGGSAQGREKLSVIFGSARGDGGRTAVTISHDDIEDDVRVVAVDLKGEEHAPIRNQSRGVRDYQQMEVEYDLPLSSIKEFRLQTSPFEWVEFADIPLDPRAR